MHEGAGVAAWYTRPSRSRGLPEGRVRPALPVPNSKNERERGAGLRRPRGRVGLAPLGRRNRMREARRFAERFRIGGAPKMDVVTLLRAALDGAINEKEGALKRAAAAEEAAEAAKAACSASNSTSVRAAPLPQMSCSSVTFALLCPNLSLHARGIMILMMPRLEAPLPMVGHIARADHPRLARVQSARRDARSASASPTASSLWAPRGGRTGRRPGRAPSSTATLRLIYLVEVRTGCGGEGLPVHVHVHVHGHVHVHAHVGEVHSLRCAGIAYMDADKRTRRYGARESDVC